MDPSNFRKRVLHKLAEELELPKLTFQVIRRTIATLAETKGHVRMFRASCGTDDWDDHGCLYAALTGSTYDARLNPRGVGGTGTEGPAPEPPMTPPSGDGRRIARPREQARLGMPIRNQPREHYGSEVAEMTVRSQLVVWFWNLRQRCDKVAEGGGAKC